MWRQLPVVFCCLLMLCLPSLSHAEQTWSPQRLFTSFERAKREARPSGGLIRVRAPIVKLVLDEDENPVLVVGKLENYTVWCYLADDQAGKRVKKGQMVTIEGRTARKFPEHDAVQMHECRVQ